MAKPAWQDVIMYSVAAGLTTKTPFSGHFETEGERLQNCQNEQQWLDITYSCTNIKDKLNVLWELKPVEPLKHRYAYMQHQQEEPEAARSPMRLVFVIDVSHSMAETYGDESDISKLERVKLFAILLVRSMDMEDSLGIITFGTVSKTVLPMKRMSPDVQVEAVKAIQAITMGGVTHLSAGLFSAIDLFNQVFTKCRYFDDHIMIFTDGMANEGMIETAPLLAEMRKRIGNIKKDCHYEDDYTIKMTTLGTAGFMPELIFDIGQAFSSDAYYFLDETSHLELNLIRPLVLRQVGMVSNVRIKVTGLNGVTLEKGEMNAEYRDPERSSDDPTVAYYVIHDMFADLRRHLTCSINLPPKHKKLLKDKDVCMMEIQYRDSQLTTHALEKKVGYADLPRKEVKNMEPNLLFYAKEESRSITYTALNTAADRMKKLDRKGAKKILSYAVASIREHCENMSLKLSEMNHADLVAHSEPMLLNMEHCNKIMGDFTVRWDDGWARLKALSSSLGREVPNAAGVFVPDSEIYTTQKINDKISEMCYKLTDIYKSHGLATTTLESYLDVMRELEKKLMDEEMVVEEKDVNKYRFT